MRTPTRRTQLPNHVSDSTTQVGQDHVATGVVLVLGTINHLHRLENTAELATQVLLTYISQVSEHHRLDQSLLAKPKNFHKRLLHRPGWCSSPFRLVQAKKSQIHRTSLPRSKQTQTPNSSNRGQQRTHPDVHPRQNP
jgi:hypothetical protein